MKKIILAIITILMTGCSVNYHLSINDDFKIVERVSITEDDTFYDNYYRTTKDSVLNKLLENYKNILDEKKYNYYITDDDNPKIIIEKTYNDYDEYLNNTILLNDYFEKISFINSDGILKISTNGFNPNDSDNPERFYVDDLVISITPIYKVINSNASEYNEKIHTYYYNIKDNTDTFNIMMELDTSSKYDVIMDNLIVIIVAVGLVIASWILVFVKKKKQNY